MLYADIYGFIAAILSTIAFLPQVIKTWRFKKAEDISITTLLIFISGLLFWIIYGFQTRTIPVLLANTMTLILNTMILVLKLVYARPNSSERSDSPPD